MTLQYDQNSINLQISQGESTFIFDSNSAEQTDILFNDWDALMGKLRGVQGIKNIIVSGALNVITPGIHDMTNIRLIGESLFSSISVDEAVFQNLTYIKGLSVIAGNIGDNVGPTFEYSGQTENLSFIDSSFLLDVNSTSPMFNVTSGSVVTFTAVGSSFATNNPAVPLITVDATSSLFCRPKANASGGNSWGGSLGANAFVDVAGGGTFILRLASGDVFWDQNQVNGPTSTIYADDYEAANVVDWAGTEPESMKNALDRLAAHVGPVPV